MSDGDAIGKEVAEFIRCPDDRFESLALTLFAHQFAANAPYRAYCEALDAVPRGIRSWREIRP